MQKRIFLLLIGFTLLCIPTLAQQDTVRTLIFTEWFGNRTESAYLEITNVGDSTIDLSDFYFSAIVSWSVSIIDWSKPTLFPDNNSNRGMRLWGTLEPGKTLVVKNVYDTPLGDGGHRDIPRTDKRFFEVENLLPIHVTKKENGLANYWYRPEWEMWGKDSVDSYFNVFDVWWGTCAHALWYCFPDGSDSVMVDQVRFVKDPNNNGLLSVASDVAGVAGASWDHILVRKPSVKKGNMDWDKARGIDITDSEWIPVVPWLERDQAFTTKSVFSTIGVHGDYSLDVSSTSVTIDEANSTITVPWGVMKGDSFLNVLDLGPSMGWYYTEDSTSFADSAFSTVRDGDILRLIAVGENLEMKDYTLKVSAATQDDAKVFPKRRQRYAAMEEEDFNGVMWGGEPYYVTDGIPGMDSIGDVSFGTRVDSLLTYLEKAPDATWDIDWVDGMERVDLKVGDKLVVTASDGATKKEYFIAVDEFEGSENAELAAITWPDKPYFLEGWSGDTIPNFSSTSTQYQVMLPYGTSSVPALMGLRSNMNSKVAVKKAVSLKGSQEERTTLFTVTAQDDSTTKEYKVVFSVEKPPENIQLYQAEPFFSEVLSTRQGAFEFVNVGDVPIDLSKYLFGHSNGNLNPAQLISAINSNPAEEEMLWRYSNGYVPGYKFTDDTAEWVISPGKLYFDNAVDPVVDPGDVFVIGAPVPAGWAQNVNEIKVFNQADVIANYSEKWPVNLNTWGLTNIGGWQNPPTWDAIYLFSIDNDSILDGDKEVWEDPSDYTLIDAVGDPGIADWTLLQIGDHTKDGWGQSLCLRRKPHIYQGNIAMDSTSNIAEWLSNSKLDPDFTYANVYEYVGSHTFDPVTVHLSTVASTSYLVSDGYSGIQSIQGDFGTGTSLEAFFGNLSKADDGQTMLVIDGTDGSMKELAEMISGADTLKVTSFDGKNTTKYELIDQPLSDDAIVKLVNDPSGLSIEIDGTSGMIKGVKYGALLKEYLDSLKMPDLATWTVINQNGEPIPQQQLNSDTIMVDTKMGDHVYIEVIAQDGATKVTYKFEPDVMSSDAYVISTVYEVDQENKTLSGLVIGTGTGLFWEGIEVVKGASASLTDKLGFERTQGYLNYDDKLKVVSEDGSVTAVYYLNFFDELNKDGNQAPAVSMAFADSTLIGVLQLELSASVDDDGLPVGSALTYKWEVTEGETGNVSFSDDAALSTTVTFSAIGTYKLQITVGDSEKTSKTEVTIVVEAAVGMNPALAESMKIYPNPVSRTLNIELEKMGNTSHVKIISITGSVVYEIRFSESRHQVDVSKFRSGLYFVIVKSGENEIIQKISITQ